MSTPTCPPDLRPRRDVYTISRLNREARALLEGGLPLLWVEAEISNLSRPGSGHLYFTLKDANAQVRCAMFRTHNRHLGFEPEDGLQVLVRARVGLYEARGDFQLIVEHMEEAGDGALRRAFEILKQRLAAQGLFDSARKRALPALPRRIGVITSPTGAAIRDILSVLRRRFPAIAVLLYPVAVQGASATGEITAALRLASQRRDCDVLILARGGGSLEDLWSFNDEGVARAIYDCAIPVVSGIGHEIDFTIADFVADQRAPTPSGAAELASPDAQEWSQRLEQQCGRIHRALAVRLARPAEALRGLIHRLRAQHPGQRLRQRTQRLDDLDQRLRAIFRGGLQVRRSGVAEWTARLHRHRPTPRVRQLEGACGHLAHRLRAGLARSVERRHDRVAELAHALDAVSPLATLGRGYAILRRLPRGAVLRSATDTSPGDRVEARLARGQLVCRVEEVQAPPLDDPEA
ncbi:MAG: exodeoxyribonuclease VII large subunit [Chromatiales bacterium 21-64-14]|nr:MAG: exodeoxyribonuclease VII large subunit [Chromatiales bacterium 21-64-14]